MKLRSTGCFRVLISLCLVNFVSVVSAAPKQDTSVPSKAVETKKPQKKEGTSAALETLEKQNRKYQSLESFSRVLSLLESMYVDEKTVQSDVLVEKAIRGMVSNLDPHTSYLPMQQLRDLTSDTAGKFGGIGIVITEQNKRLEIVEVMEDSPAQKAGLKIGDVIYSIDKTVVTPTNIENIIVKMRGLPGTVMQMEVLPSEEVSKVDPKATAELKKIRPKMYLVKREIIRTSSVTHAMLSNGNAYVRISVFQEDTGDEVDKALRKYEAQKGGLNGLILDLRGNPGGLLDQAVKVVDMFVDSGIIVSTVGRDTSKQEVEYATKRISHPYTPLVVLVNEGSASASEIVAGALQDHERALILGSTTFGKGSVQSIVPLPNGAGLKMTIARYYTPKGRSIQAKGITPDVPFSPPAVVSQPSNEGAKSSEERIVRKEADLEGHIVANDLSDVAKIDAFTKEMEGWPANLKYDAHVRVAFSYLKSWSRFDRKDVKPVEGTLSQAKNKIKQ